MSQKEDNDSTKIKDDILSDFESSSSSDGKKKKTAEKEKNDSNLNEKKENKNEEIAKTKNNSSDSSDNNQAELENSIFSDNEDHKPKEKEDTSKEETKIEKPEEKEPDKIEIQPLIINKTDSINKEKTTNSSRKKGSEPATPKEKEPSKSSSSSPSSKSSNKSNGNKDYTIEKSKNDKIELIRIPKQDNSSDSRQLNRIKSPSSNKTSPIHKNRQKESPSKSSPRNIRTSNSKRKELTPPLSPSSTSSSASYSSSESIYEYTKKELEDALSLMLKRKSLPPYEMRPSLINYARKLSTQKLLEEEYDEASELDMAIDILYSSIQHDNNESDMQNASNILQQRLDNAKSREKQLREKWDEVIQQNMEEADEKIDELKKRHKEEIEEFEKEWSKPEVMNRFNKPSSELLQIRKQQKSLALIHDFTRAKQMKIEAEALERKETSIATKKFRESMKSSFEQLLETQKNELSCLMMSIENQRAILETYKNSELETAAATVKQIEAKLNQSKSAKKPVVFVPRVQQRSQVSQSQNAAVTGVISQRTRSRLAKYRKSSDKVRLTLPNQDIKAIMNSVSSSRKRKN
ncbi:hypothetical protein GPJ56_009370 [Histomonas meleagridis]|uniref:uncharacterized protein n=1 Tax=Histomonas meleagridis TaxID=135588 RepID=UPI00355AACF9|nr:hypothetical protein GPJ56_009370 [Histomonas meleagridis]KAH0797322.1 hypothetical protein GO595_010004 [Histomonas meleagridis]